jgi:hypothetical protein
VTSGPWPGSQWRPPDPPRNQIHTWQDAEINAATWMRHWGYHDARAQPGGPDGGIDVRATGAVGQVKLRAAQIGRPDLQRLVGASPPAVARMFFTGVGYSAKAIEYADETEIALFIFALDGAMTPVNGTARRIATWQQSNPYAPPGPHAAYQAGRPMPSAVPGSGGLRANWRAVIGYAFVVLFLGTLVRPGNYGGTGKLVKLVVVLAFHAGVATWCFLAHWRSPSAAWFPHPSRRFR